jgi:hypothetical protein
MIEEICAQLKEIFPNDMPSSFKEHVIETIRPSSFVRRQIKNNIFNFLLIKRQIEVIQITTVGNNVVKLVLQTGGNRSSHSTFEFLIEKCTFLCVINNHSTRGIHNLADHILPVSLRSHSMEKFCVLIPKLNQPLCKSLSPVSSLHSSKIMNLSFDDHSELKFMMGKRPDLLEFIKKMQWSCYSLAIRMVRLEVFLAHNLSILLSSLNFALMVLALSRFPIEGVDHAFLINSKQEG